MIRVRGKSQNIFNRPPLPPLAKGWRGFGLAVMLVAFATFITPSQVLAQADDKAPLFESDIAPILKTHCLKCHASDDPQGGLDLSTAASLMKGSDEGPVVIKGSAEKSVLLQKIAS